MKCIQSLWLCLTCSDSGRSLIDDVSGTELRSISRPRASVMLSLDPLSAQLYSSFVVNQNVNQSFQVTFGCRRRPCLCGYVYSSEFYGRQRVVKHAPSPTWRAHVFTRRYHDDRVTWRRCAHNRPADVAGRIAVSGRRPRVHVRRYGWVSECVGFNVPLDT